MRLDRHCYLAAAFKGFLSPSHGHGGCYTTGERAPSTLIAVRSEPVRGNRAGLTASLSLPIFHHQPACQVICVLGDCPGTRLEAIGFGHSGIQANVRPARQIRPRGSMLYFSYLNFIFIFCGSGVVFGDMRGGAALRHSTWERAMQRVFIIAIMLLGITAAQGQTVLQGNGQTSSSESAINSEGAIGSGPLNVSASSLPSMSSPSASSQSGPSSGSPSTTGSASGGSGAASSGSGAAGSGSVSPQSPLLLPGEIPDTSTQAASTTATAPSSSSPICPPPVPSTDGGSANLTEIAGASLGGC